jgi:holo-[acyl-carrier protein] synthase
MVGIGIDIIEINRIEEAILKNERFLERLFTEKEQAYFASKNNRHETIAGFFACKEAVAKVLGTGISGFKWKDIEISHTEVGQPVVELKNAAKDIAEEKGITNILVSISHCKTYAVANAFGV